MSEYYITRPRRASIVWWNNINHPPEGVHDVFFGAADAVWYGFVKTPSGERLIRVGQYLVTYEDTGERDILEHRDVQEQFVKVVE